MDFACILRFFGGDVNADIFAVFSYNVKNECNQVISMNNDYPGSSMMRERGWNPYIDEEEDGWDRRDWRQEKDRRGSWRDDSKGSWRQEPRSDEMWEMPRLNEAEQQDMIQWQQASSGDMADYWRTTGDRNGQPYLRCSFTDVLEDEQRMEQELRRLQSMYPQAARDILPLIEEACDKMEYEGSMMFDERPDQSRVLRISDEIYGQISQMYPGQPEPQRDEVLSMQYQERRRRPPEGNFLKDLVQVMLIQEMHRRRCRHHRCRRMY